MSTATTGSATAGNSVLAPVSGPAVWDAGAMDRDRSWVIELPDAALDEIERAGQWILESGRTMRDIGAADLHLDALRLALAPVGRELADGRGAVLIRSFRVAGRSADEIKAQFWAMGACLGVGVSQNRRGEYVGDVVDLADRFPTARPFQLGGELVMHRDPIDVVGLLCIRHAKSGGLSRIGSSGLIHNLILAERPDLLARLYEGYVYHRLDEDRGTTATLTPYRLPVFLRGADGKVSSFFIPGPIERAKKLGANLDPLGIEAIRFFVEVSKRPGIYYDMNLMPGEIQFLNNRSAFHARTDYEDYSEWEQRRYMLRLWLMMPEWPILPQVQRYLEDEDRCGGGIPFSACA